MEDQKTDERQNQDNSLQDEGRSQQNEHLSKSEHRDQDNAPHKNSRSSGNDQDGGRFEGKNEDRS